MSNMPRFETEHVAPVYCRLQPARPLQLGQMRLTPDLAERPGRRRMTGVISPSSPRPPFQVHLVPVADVVIREAALQARCLVSAAAVALRMRC
jgi:hypothetical protein